MHDRIRRGVGLLALVLLGFGVYAEVLDAPFHYDDYQNIVDNPRVRWTRLHSEAVLPAAVHKKLREELKQDLQLEAMLSAKLPPKNQD